MGELHSKSKGGGGYKKGQDHAPGSYPLIILVTLINTTVTVKGTNRTQLYRR